MPPCPHFDLKIVQRSKRQSAIAAAAYQIAALKPEEQQMLVTTIDMLPLSKERAMELYERDLTVYAVVDGGSAEMLFDREELALLSVDRKRK